MSIITAGSLAKPGRIIVFASKFSNFLILIHNVNFYNNLGFGRSQKLSHISPLGRLTIKRHFGSDQCTIFRLANASL